MVLLCAGDSLLDGSHQIDLKSEGEERKEPPSRNVKVFIGKIRFLDTSGLVVTMKKIPKRHTMANALPAWRRPI